MVAEFVYSTAELSRRGVRPDASVMILLGADDLIPGRRKSRARVVAAGLSDADIDRMIDEEREVARLARGDLREIEP